MDKPKSGLAIILGGVDKGEKGDKSSPFSSKPDDDKSPSSDKGDDELPPGFEEAAVEAFPELDGDTDRIKALERCIKACTDSY